MPMLYLIFQVPHVISFTEETQLKRLGLSGTISLFVHHFTDSYVPKLLRCIQVSTENCSCPLHLCRIRCFLSTQVH